MITKEELEDLRQMKNRANQDSMDAQETVNESQRLLDSSKRKLQAAQTRAAAANNAYQRALQQFHVQQQGRAS